MVVDEYSGWAYTVANTVSQCRLSESRMGVFTPISMPLGIISSQLAAIIIVLLAQNCKQRTQIRLPSAHAPLNGQKKNPKKLEELWKTVTGIAVFFLFAASAYR